MRRLLPLVVSLALVAAAGVYAEKIRPSSEQVLTSAGVALTPEAVTGVLNHSDPFIRKHAATLLGTWRTRMAIPSLKAALDDEQGFVRLAAAGALLRMGDQSGMTELKKQLHAPLVGNAVTAATYLLEGSDVEGFEVLMTRLESGKVEPLDRLLIVRFFAAAMQIASLREESEKLLIAALDDGDRYVRYAVAEDLSRHRSPAIERAFERIANDKGDPLRKYAAAYLNRQAPRKR